MTFSKLIQNKLLSPNYSSREGNKVIKITPHHTACKWTAKRICESFLPRSRNASCNYAIGYKGEIWGCVPEEYRAWTSSSKWNDQRAITIEISNSKTGGNWPVSEASINSLIELCVDICKRYKIKKLVFDRTTSGSITEHKMFAATACPGPYLDSKLKYVESKVNSRLEADSKKATVTKTKYKVIEKDGMNVRKSYTTDSEIKGLAEYGKTYVATKTHKNSDGTTWVYFSGKKGWVCYKGKKKTYLKKMN